MTCFSKLNKRLEIMAPQHLADGVGGSTISWGLLATVWAQITSHHADERLRENTLTSRTTHTITIRYRGDISADMKFKLAQKEFEILSIVNVDEQNLWLKILSVQQRL